MKLLIYSILTQAIILLSRLRNHLGLLRSYKSNRLCYAVFMQNGRGWGNGVDIECCDCGLTHRVWLHSEYENIELSEPLRPEGYNYKLRIGAATHVSLLSEIDLSIYKTQPVELKNRPSLTYFKKKI